MRAPVAIVFGIASSGAIATARLLTEEKWSVVIVDTREAPMKRARDELQDRAEFLHEDVHTVLGIRNALAGCLERFGGVDTVINVPEIPPEAAFGDVDPERLNEALNRSVIKTTMIAQIFSAEMITEVQEENESVERPRRSRSFIHILNPGALAADPTKYVESTVQMALLGTSRNIALALAPHRIRSNAIVAVRPRAEREEGWLKQRTPLQRSAKADEIAGAALYLASPQAAFITGHALVLDGGRSVLNGVLPPPDV